MGEAASGGLDHRGTRGAMIEPLEERRLLFTLTVTPDSVNPLTGLGTVTAHFGYTIPILLREIPTDDNEAPTATEPFDDEDINVPVTNGFTFAQNVLQTFFTGPNPTYINGNGEQNDRDLRVSLVQNQSIRFRFLETNGGVRRMNAVAFDMGAGPNGLDTTATGTRLELLRDGAVVQTFSGQALAQLGTFNGTTNEIRYNVVLEAGFDEIRFASAQNPPDNNTYQDVFAIDNITGTFPAGRFRQFTEGRIFGARAVLTGPVNSAVRFLDLYGREMLQNIGLGTPGGGSVPNVDRNDDGVPEFNDGIGRIEITGADASTSFSLFGGRIQVGDDPLQFDFFQNGFGFNLVTDFTGFASQFEQTGFGYALTNDVPPAVIGLPPGPASVIVGSPFVRDNSSGDDYLSFPGTADSPQFDPNQWVRSDQGVFSTDGRSVASVIVHGIIHGSSRFRGALGRFSAGVMLGSLTVDGDLGSMFVAGDAGLWVRDDLLNGRFNDQINDTTNQLVVGRTLGQLHVGGRSAMDITVLGDVNNESRARLDYLQYFEQEITYGLGDEFTVEDVVDETTTGFLTATLAGQLRTVQAVPFGLGTYRNDSILSAEFVGGPTSAVRLAGTVSLGDPLNSEDPADVYGFSASADQPVVINFEGFGANSGRFYARVVDADGRVLATHEDTFTSTEQTPPGFLSVRFTFNPEATATYYLVVGTLPDANVSSAADYEIVMSGLLTSTVGLLRYAGRTGFSGNPDQSTAITVLSGSLGSFRVGTGYIASSGTDTSPGTVTNTDANVDDLLNLGTVRLSIAASVHSIVTGSDIASPADGRFGPDIRIGGDLGQLVTGLSPLAGVGPGDGDINAMTLSVGGRISVIDARGAIGFDQDPEIVAVVGPVLITTGTSGGRGDIGAILAGAFIVGNVTSVRTSPGSTIDRVFAGVAGSADTDTGTENSDLGAISRGQILFTTGAGSDVRFADFNRISTSTDSGAGEFSSSIPLVYGQALTLTDDGGGSIRIVIADGAADANTSFGLVRLMPIDGSQGVAIARIEVTLRGAANLRITGVDPGVVSIGRIIVTTDQGNAPPLFLSSILIAGNTQIDVWRIDHRAGPGLDQISNTTPGGDIVSADLRALNRLTITRGDLGSTQTTPVGPRRIGPFRGIQQGLNTTFNGALGIATTDELGNPVIQPNWTGQIFTPVVWTTLTIPGDVTLEDIGSPFDPYLNGIVVRTGNVLDVTVAGRIGDIILQGGDLLNVVANSDGTTASGGFDGIVGTLYAANIGTVDIGDGIAAPGSTPFAQAGLFAIDDITRVIGGRRAGPAFIRGVISASNSVADAGTSTNGIILIDLASGGFDGAFISVSNADAWWSSARATDADNDFALGDVVEIRGTGVNFFRSDIFSSDLRSFQLTSGAWDASRANALGDVGTIVASEFRNSTLNGEILEFRFNEIRAGGDLGTLRAGAGQGGGGSGQASGDISDLVVDVLGSVTGSIAARNMARTRLEIDNTLTALTLANDLRASRINVGRILSLTATGDIRSSDIFAAGPIELVTAGQNITSTRIESTGPDGRIGTVRAQFFLTGEIISSGVIATVSSTAGDVVASIRTSDADGALQSITAAGDLRISLEVSGDVGTVTAGRNIGTRGGGDVLNIRGNLGSISAPNGQIYADVRVGQAITGTITIGRVSALPGNDLVSTASFRAFGRINAVVIAGDFNGSITSESGGIGSVAITNGSFRPGNRITARDGDIGAITITGGHLLGDIITDGNIGSIQLLRGLDGFVGDMGISPFLSSATPVDAFRNQLPPGVGQAAVFQGPLIRAGKNISAVTVAGGFWEAGLFAGHSIGTVVISGIAANDLVTPGLFGSFIVAGDSIFRVEINNFAGGVLIAAGIYSLGADNRPGGTGADADLVKWGTIGDVVLRGGAAEVRVSAGINAGPDQIYNTADDIVANGLSRIGTVTVAGPVVNTSAFVDNGLGFTTPGVTRGGPGLAQAEPSLVVGGIPAGGVLVPASGLVVGTARGEFARITFSGPGQAYWDQANQRVALINTTFFSTLVIDGANGSVNLTDFNVLSNDGASLGTLIFRPSLFGNSTIFIDGYLVGAAFGYVDATATIGAGNDIGSIVFGAVLGGTIRANYIGSLGIAGDFGRRDRTGEASVRLLAAGQVTILGTLAGAVSFERDVNAVTLGAVDRGNVRSGGTIGALTAASLREVRISARDGITSAAVTGTAFDSLIYAGGDLGTDGAFGGAGSDADVVTDGTIGTVTIGGDFLQSDIAAGVIRGTDGFLGTDDDVADDGRSAIGTVTIAGTRTGSNLNSESYRVASTGTIGTVTVGGNAFSGSGNFLVSGVGANPFPIQVLEIAVTQDARVFSAAIRFNEPVEASTIAPALNIFEVRNAGATTIRLAENLDYTVAYDGPSRTATVTFARAVTERNLPQTSSVPGPGVFRFTLDAGVLRGESQRNLLDGNRDGVAAGDADDFSEDQIVGDAGDKLNAGRATASNGASIDFYPAADLNLVLDDDRTGDGLPDPNVTYTLRGSIGDHPDIDTDVFRLGSDVDLYRITLKAGQILRIGATRGTADLVVRSLLNSAGDSVYITSSLFDQFIFDITAQDNEFVRTLPATPPAVDDATVADAILIKQTGTYYLMISAAEPATYNVVDPAVIANLPPISGAVGDYRLTLQVFDDLDTGFAGDTNSGNGVAVADAPEPIAFAGSDGALNTPDDIAAVTLGLYTFTLDAGADGLRGTADDTVSGNNGTGITSVRTSGADRVFGTPDDTRTSFVAASIGTANPVGVPSEVESDADVYQLGNGAPMAPGTRVRATLTLTEFGSNLGQLQPSQESVDSIFRITDLRGTVQFGLFETTTATGVSDALLVGAPSRISPVGGTPGTAASDGVSSYGYDANGDFFIEFAIPGRQGIDGAVPARYALFIQGAIRSDYGLIIVTEGAVSRPGTTQNVLLETRGGVIDWLEAGQGVTTTLRGYTTSVLGFSGQVGGQTVDNYVLSRVISNLTTIFSNAGTPIEISTTSASFEQEDFSTVFVTASQEPPAFFDNGTFGASQRVDFFNANRNDQSAVFLPSLSLLGNAPDQAGVDVLVQSLTAAVGRRIGELLGLRITTSVADITSPVPIMSSNSVAAAPGAGGVYRFSSTTRDLSAYRADLSVDTDFYLGSQNSQFLIDRLFTTS